MSNMMEILPPIQSRFYSISSSSSLFPDTLHMSVSVINSQLKNGNRFKVYIRLRLGAIAQWLLEGLMP